MAQPFIISDRTAVLEYYQRLAGPVQAMSLRLDRIIRDELPRVDVGIKWAVPFYFTTQGPLCYVSPAKRHVTFGMARGSEIEDRTGLLSGTGRSSIRKATLKAGKPLPEEAMRGWLRAATALPPEI